MASMNKLAKDINLPNVTTAQELSAQELKQPNNKQQREQ